MAEVSTYWRVSNTHLTFTARCDNDECELFEVLLDGEADATVVGGWAFFTFTCGSCGKSEDYKREV
jgi:predicted nucleic-acid-binding Zn-ribbon protein